MKFLATISTLALVTLAVVPAEASYLGFGPRLGYTHDDSVDQVHFGGQVWIGDLFTSPIVVLPSLELGLGGDATILAINGDVVYEFTEFEQDLWGFYAGAGLAFNRYDIDEFDDTSVGLNILGGATHKLSGGKVAFGEFRLGIEDSPDFKLTFGLNVF
jgi:hypothetical protein